LVDGLRDMQKVLGSSPGLPTIILIINKKI